VNGAGGSGRFPRRERLTGKRDFQKLFQQGTRIERPSLIVLWKESGRQGRVGFAVSRQTRSAVRRNRVRRRLREAYRLARGAEAIPGDLVIVARRSALTGPFDTLVRDVRSALGAITQHRRGGRRG